MHEWLGYRYTEKCEFDAAQFHFKVHTSSPAFTRLQYLLQHTAEYCLLQKLRDVLDPLPDMADTLLVWGSSFKIPVTAADDPIQLAIEEEIKANICKTPFGYISLEGQTAKAAVSDTDRAIAEMAAKLKERERRRGSSNTVSQSVAGSLGSGLEDDTLGPLQSSARMPHMSSMQGLSVSTAGQLPQYTAPFSAASLLPNVIATPPPPVVPPHVTVKPDTEDRDLAWFGGVHHDCNTILYKAPLQGWNTLLPSTALTRNTGTPKKTNLK